MSARSPDGKAIGAIELKLNGHTDLTERDDMNASSDTGLANLSGDRGL